VGQLCISEDKRATWPRRRGVPLLVVAAGWGLSRLFFRLALDIDFDASSLGWFWQYVDPPMLRADPWGSVFYHHVQPPLWNLYLAAALWLGGEEPSRLLAAGHLAIGLALHLGLYALMRRLGIRTGLAVGGALAFALSPASVLYESWLFYTLPLATLLVASAWALHRLARRGTRTPDAIVFFTLIAAAVLTRSLFHLAWFLAVVGFVLWVLRPHARRLLIISLLPTLLCVAVYAKNLAIVGQFTSSTWLGMNLARLVIERIPMPERVQMVRDGRIGAVSLVTPFSPLDRYPPALRRLPPSDVHPVMREYVKASGVVNYNHLAYVEISRRYQRDAVSLIASDPCHYAQSIIDAWLLFAWSPTEYSFLDANRTHISGWNRLWNALVYGVPAAWCESGEPPDRLDRHSLLRHGGLLFVLVACMALAYASWIGIRDLRTPHGDRARGLTLLFIVATVLWVACVGNAVELRENNRFRFMVEPLIAALALLTLEHGLRRASPASSPNRRDAED